MGRSIQQIEHLSLEAWPALEQRVYDGWIVRFANSYTRRSNSISPVDSSSLPVAEKITSCEALYRERGQRTVFKMTSEVFPHNLDDILAENGYIKEAPTRVQQRLTLVNVELPSLKTVSISQQFNDDWLHLYCRSNNLDICHLPTMQRMLNRIAPAQGFATLYHEGQMAAVGLGVVTGDALWFFDVATDVALRNRGLGKQLMLHLIQWGKANGATTAYLQVMADNAPAVRLYEKLGFREIYEYWYRVKTDV